MKSVSFSLFFLLLSATAVSQVINFRDEEIQTEFEKQLDSIFHRSSLIFMPELNKPGKLSDEDYETLAKELDIEVAAIKAVVEIESGKTHEGFTESGKPLINFDLGMFKRRLAKEGISLKSAKQKAPIAFNAPDVGRFGSYQDAQYARFEAACSISEKAAVESSFWGLFQIGGFNWHRCGLASREEFVRLMGKSEQDQLRIFARFLENGNMLRYIREKKWSEFARRYNGPGYKRRGYDRRLANAYKKHKQSK